MKKKAILGSILGIIALGVIGILGYYRYQGSHFIATNDAALCGNQIAISSEIMGRIFKLTAAEGQKVSKGDVLVRLDDSMLKSQLEQAKVNDELASRNLVLVKVKVDQAQEEFNRASMQYQQKVIPQDQYDKFSHNLASAKAGLDIALSQEKLAETQTSTLKTSLAHATITSPVDGIVAKKWLMQGDVIQPSQAIYTLYDFPNIWVQANFKETQVQLLKIGNPVQISIDAFSGKIFTGKVESMGVATSSQFSLLPSDNSSGNFVKVTQRIPVKISINDTKEMVIGTSGFSLAPGMSAEVRVKISKG